VHRHDAKAGEYPHFERKKDRAHMTVESPWAHFTLLDIKFDNLKFTLWNHNRE
jgi:hypothetical protein